MYIKITNLYPFSNPIYSQSLSPSSSAAAGAAGAGGFSSPTALAFETRSKLSSLLTRGVPAPGVPVLFDAGMFSDCSEALEPAADAAAAGDFT